MLTPGVTIDQATFTAGILTAMSVGTPQDDAARPEFVFPDTTVSTSPVDADGVPYDPAARPVVTPGARLRVLCAVEFEAAAGRNVDFAVVTPTRARITLLDEQYQLVKGFAYVLLGGDRWLYRTVEAVGLGATTVWTVHVVAEDDT